MALAELFRVASIPVLKVLLLTALGSYLSLDHVNILGENARNQLNNLVFYVFNPALVSSNLAKTVTFESIVLLWFMPLNILLTFIIGSVLGWILLLITRPPQHLKGLVLGSCSAGNLGNLPIIIIPTICKEKGSPFGDPNVCYTYGMAYASLSMAIGAIYLWSYVYNIVRISSSKIAGDDSNVNVKSTGETKSLQGNSSELILGMLRKINMRALFAPSTTGAIVGFIVGTVSPIRNLLIGDDTAPLRVLQDSASLLADAAIPTVTLIIGGNLLKGLKGSGIQLSIIIGIVAVRYVLLPLFGIIIVKGAIHYGLVHSDPLYQFVLLLQFALTQAMNIGTITQLFGAGQNECSVILLWTYSLASVSLSIWSTFFMWLVA